jgi:hypothetical protein
MREFLVIDTDGHVTESAASLQRYLPAEYHNRPLRDAEAWDRGMGGTRGKNNEDPHVQLADMDADGIDVQVIYPTSLLNLYLYTYSARRGAGGLRLTAG